ncbi:MAG: hypothetical protein ABL977_06235 [Candidatus Eisenbacteria bacterium]
MNANVRGRRFAAAAALGLFATFSGSIVGGCGKSPTAPAGDEHQASFRYASLIARERLEAGGLVSPDSLNAAVQLQHEYDGLIARQRQDVVGTAASTLDGRPVVLVLTRKPVGRLPGLVRGRRAVEYVVGDVTAQAYYAGTSFGPSTSCSEGTAGAIVTDGIRNYWLSNWHVFVRQTGAVGSPIVSPSRVAMSCGTSTTVANVSRFVPVKFDGSTNTVDCAIARIVPGTSVSAIQAAGSNSYRASATTVKPVVGLLVKKVGASTGFTTGKITAINVALNVNYAGIGPARFAGVVMFSPMCTNGDSGSLICTQAGNNPVALLFAASNTATFGCPIGSVFTAIGAHVAN